MKLKVYHAKNPTFLDTKPVDFTDENFELVANVECDNLGDVFYLTNHVDHEWWKNAGVKCVKRSRSTSVGDVVVAEDGQRFRCLSAGWGAF